MSLKQDLLDAGVNLSDMARDMPDENYPNLYEVLRKEERGMPITRGPQLLRLEKLQQYLKGILDGTVQAVRREEQEVDADGIVVEAGEQWRIMQQQTRPVPRGLVMIHDPIRIKGTLCGPGTVINLTQGHGQLEAGTYMFLRALAHVDNPDTPVEIDLYGGSGYLRAKMDKDGWPKWFARYRTVRPDCFSKARPPTPKSAQLTHDEDDEGNNEED